MMTPPVDLDRLRQAMRGGDPEIARGEAFALLAASGYAQREILLGDVVQDLRESPSIRAAAAIALGRIATRDSEQVLLANLHDDDPGVQVEVIIAVGQIGGREALTAVGELHFSKGDVRVGAAQFAAALIAHRLGLEGHDLPLPAEEDLLKVSGERSQPMPATKLARGEAAKVIADLARQPYGIEYEPGALVRLEVLGRVNVVCPNHEIGVSGGIARLAQRKALAGVVALRSPETGNHSVSYVLMTAPSAQAGRVRILAPRRSGRLALAGIGDAVGDRLEFRLRAVRQPGARAMELDGEFADGELHLRRAVISREKVGSRRPELGEHRLGTPAR